MIVKLDPNAPQPAHQTDSARPGWRESHLWQIPAARECLAIALGAGLLYGVYYFWDVFAPLLIAALLAFIFHPLVTWLQERFDIPRVASTMAILVISGICLTALVSWLGPRLVSELSELLSRIPGYIRALADRPQWTGSAMERQMTELAETIRTRPQELLVAAWPGTVRTARFFGAAVGATTYAILLIILIPIYFFFFCWRFDRIHALQRYIPASRREQILQIVNAMGNVFAAFFRGRLIGAAIMAVLFSVGLWIAAVPYWFLLAIVSALLNIIPYAAFMGWIAVVLIKYLDAVAATQGLGVSFTEVFVWPTVVYLLVQVVDTWLITPLVQARSVNLNPVSVIVVLFIGGTLAGLVGLILAIPVAASIKVLVLELWAPRIRDWSLSH